jgi:hypothetical protein
MDHDNPADQSVQALDDTWRTARSFGGGMDLGREVVPYLAVRYVATSSHHPTSQVLANKFLAIAGYFRPRPGLVF